MALNDFSVELKEIIDKMDENEKLEQMKRLTEPKVFVDQMKLKSNLFEVKTFDSITRLTHFSVDQNGDYDALKPIPKLLSKQIKDKELTDTDLEVGFDIHVKSHHLIEDYEKYRQKKWNYLMRCLSENEMIEKYNPDFVSFAGPVADIMITVHNTGSQWTLKAQKLKGVIYLFKIRNDKRMDENFGEINIKSFCGVKFLHLVTDRDSEKINEFEKCFAINEVNLDSHKLFTMSEIDCVDENDNAIEIKSTEVVRTSRHQEFFKRKKLLNFWSKASVSGIESMIFGNRNNFNILTDIEERKLCEIAEDCTAYWSDTNCTAFLSRILNFIKNCVTEEMAVYEFGFKRGESFVSCHRLNGEDLDILPKMYAKEE